MLGRRRKREALARVRAPSVVERERRRRRRRRREIVLLLGSASAVGAALAWVLR